MKKKLARAFAAALGAICLLSPAFSRAAHADETQPDSGSSATTTTTTTTTDTTSSDSGDTSSSGLSPSTSNVTRQPISQAATDDDDAPGKFSATYFGIFYGPNIESPSRFQSNQDGVPESDKPVMLKNFLGLGYNIAEHIRVTPTAYWQWLPTGGGAYTVQDPFVTLSDDAIISSDGWNLYGDLRYHAPLSSWSKAAGEQGSVQSVQVLTFVPDESRFMFAVYGSQREYLYNSNGYGDDLELYFGPNINYQLSPTVQLTLLYEANLCHVYQTDPSLIQGDGQDIEPGISWDVSDHMNIHPYLNFYPTNLALRNTGVGMLLYWQAF